MVEALVTSMAFLTKTINSIFSEAFTMEKKNMQIRKEEPVEIKMCSGIRQECTPSTTL